MDRQEELLKFLQSKGLYEGVDLQRFKRGLMDEAKAQTLFEAMKSDGSLDADIDYDYWRDYHNIPAAQKKSQAEIQAGLGAASKPSSPLSSGVDFTAPIQDVARQTAAIAEQQRPAAPTPTPTPQRPEMQPRTFAGREIPAPVAPGREEQEIVRQDVAAMQQMQANQLAQQRAQPIAQGREVFGQVQSDFPVKSGDTAIKELEQARKERQAGERQKGIEVSPMFQDKNVPSYGKFFENTRMGKILSQGGQVAGATIAGMGAGALNLPELVANTMENISVDIAMSPYRKKLQEGKITQEQFNAYRQSARIAAQAAQKMAPVITPRQLEGLSDKYLNADELEDAARKNLKIVQERIDNSDKGFEGLIKEGRVADAFQYAATQAIGSLPYALAAAAPGGVYIVGGVTAQDKYRQIEDEVGAENMGSKETLNAIATGFVEGLSERVTKGIVDEAIEIIKGKGKVAAQKTITQKLLALAKATFGSMVSEGFSELFAKFAENIIDKATIDPNKNPSEGLLDALAIGTVSGGGITATAGTIGLAAGRRQAQAQAPGAPTAQAGAAPAPTPPAPGAPTQPPGAPAAAPTAPTRPFGPLGESAPDANVYADEILGTYRPEGGQMTAEEADRMVQDFLDTMLEVDEDEGDVKPPKPGTWEAEVYADVDARRQEIAQAVMALAATPKPTQGAPTEQAAQTPIDRLAREIYDIYGGQELTQEQANNIVDEHLASLTSKNELGETVYSAGYDQVLMAGYQIANKIVELSKQPADATQKVEQVQPQGGERQYTGAQEVQDQAATEAGIGDRAVSGGVQPEAQVTEQERSTKVSEIESRRQDIISRKTTPQEKFEFLESIPEGTIFKNDDDGSAVIVSKKTTSRGAETYELTPIVFNEDTMQWEDNPAGVKIVERKANGEFNLNAELPAIFTSQSSIVFPTDALYQRTLEALKPSVAQPATPPQEAVAPTAPTATQPEPTAGMPATDLIQDRGIFTVVSDGFKGFDDADEGNAKIKKSGSGVSTDFRGGRFAINNMPQVEGAYNSPSKPILYLAKLPNSDKTYLVAAVGQLSSGERNGRDGTVFGSIEYKEGMGNDVKRALLQETYNRYLKNDGGRGFLKRYGDTIVNTNTPVYDPNMPLSDIDLTGTYQPDAFEGATPTAPTATQPEPVGATPTAPTATQPKPVGATPTAPTTTQPEPTAGMPATDLIQDRGIFTINSSGFKGLQDEGDRDKVNKEGAGIDIDLRFSGPSERVVNNREQVWERWRNPDRPLLYLMKDTDSGKTYMVAAMGWLQYGDESGRDGTVFGSIEYKEGMGNDVKRALLDETYKRYLDADSLTQVGNRTRFLRARRGGQYKDYKRVYDPNMPLSDIDLTGTYQPDAFEGATPTTPTAPQPEVTTSATNLEAAPTQPVQAPEGGLPTEFQEISAEEEAAQEQEMLTLRQGVAELRRKAGRYIKAGIEYVRNPIDKKNPRGKTDEVFFGVRLKVPFVYKAIESNELTPSHLGNNVNPQHFIPESQPKDRTKGSDTIDAQMTIATKPEPTLLGKNITAYTGAPIVNQRNEVIQGNNRAAGLRLGYRMGKFAPYRQWLIDNAAEFGLDPKQIAAMENPVLVRELNVSDEDAKMYGNWKNSDMESGKAEEVDVITLSARLSDQEKSQIASFLDELTDNMDKTTTRAVITKNADAIVKIISRHISGNERNYIMTRDGKVTVKGYDAIENLFKQLIFDGADPQVRQAYELTMPAKAVAAINKSIKYIFGIPIEARLVDDLQDAFIVFNAFESQRQSENGLDRFDDWLNQPMLFEGSPRDVFTPISIELARRFDQMNEKKATEAQLINVFRDYQRLVKGVTGGMFGDQKPMTKAEAIKELFNVEYEPKAITEEEVQPQGAEAAEGAVGQVATQLGAQQPTGAEMVEGADVEGETTIAEPTPQPIAPPAPVNQTGTLRNPHTKKLYPNRPAGKFLDVSLVSEAELAGFLKAKTPEAKQKLKAQFKTAKRLQKIADMLGVKVYYGDGTTFGKGEAGTTSTSRSDSDPVQRAIYINFEVANENTLSHELAHAFLSRSWAKNSETMSNEQIIAKVEQIEKEGIKLKNRLVAILKDSGDADLQQLSKDIEAWAKMYPAHLRGEEYVVELAARLSEGVRNKIVDNSILAKIERAINAFFDALLGKDQIQVRLTDTKDLIDFINTLSKGVVDGDAKSIDAALELYESGRVTSPRKTIYWKKQEIKDGKAFVRELTNKINTQDNFDTVKDIESIVNKILTQVFSPGRYIVKFNSAADAAGFVENLNIGAKADNKNSIKISKDVAADMAVAINDHLSTVLDRKQQIATDLTPEENADMERFTEMFPPVRGITPEPTADETRVIEKLQAEQVKSEETFGKMINAVTVAPVANQDAIAGKPDNTKMRMVQDRTGVIPNGLAGQLTVSGSPHGMRGMFSTILSKMRSVQRQGVTKADAAKAIFAQAFDGKAVHAYAFFDKVRIIDPALITTEKEGGKEYYMFNGSGAASILLNSELGQTFLQDLSEGRRNAEFEAQAAEIISLYGIDPTTFFNRVYAAQTAFGDGNIAAAEKALNNGRSLIAAITGVGTLTKQEARALENAIINDGALPVKTTGNDRLDSRADAMALALNIDKGVARNILYHLVGKHLTSPLDHNAVDDAIDLSDMEFYPQLSMLTDSDYDNGFERLSFQRVGTGNMHNYTSLPFYNQARDFVARELDKGTFDKDIVAALSRMYPTHLTGFDAKDFFENIAGRPYRSRVGMDDVSAAVFKLIRHAYRMQWGNAKMELSNIRSFLRDRAYSYDYSIGNDLAPVRQIQRDVEKYLGYLLPKESAAYQKMQLYTSAAAFKIDKFTNRFYGDRKALREGKFTGSFVSRLAKSAVGSVNEFNTFLVNMHRWERIDRAIDIQERFLSNMYNELASIAQGLGITVQPLGTTFDAATARREIASMLAAMNAGNIESPATKLKINRFTEELASLDQAVGLRDGTDGIVDRFQQYVRSKGINPTGLKPRDLETMPEFADHFTFLREFKGMQIEYLDILRDAGHLNDERYNHLKNGTSGESDVVWDYYTPLVYDEFAFRDEMGFPPTLAESKVATFKIFGISLLRKKRGNVSPVLKKGPITVGMLDLSNLESPVEVFFHRMASAIKFKERNDAINSLANMLEQTGSNKYANFAARYSIQKDRWGTITSANDLIPDRVKNQSVTYYKDGKRRYLYFADPNDPMLAKLNKGFDDFTMWEQFWRHINNFARAAFTYMNPGFIEASLFRDVMEAGVNIMVESRGLQINNFKARLGKNFIKYYGKSSKFFLAPMFAKDSEMAEYYREIQELGGFMSWSFDSMELLEDAEAKVKDNIAYAERYAQGRTRAEKLRMSFANSLDALTAISNRVEMMPRLATYVSLRQMGIDPIRAAEAAKNITVNFEKKGASNIIRRLSVYYLFLNPSIQGVRKFGKQLYSPEGRKYLLAYAAATAAARGLLYMMPYLAGDDEEERKRIAEKIDRYIYDKWASDTKVLLPNPLDPENPFTAPKPYNGFRLASAIGEGIVDMYAGKKTSADVTENIIRQVKGAFDPIAGTSSYSNQYMDALPLPLLHPFFEAVANVDYQGRPILFDQSGAFDYLKANKGTAQIYHTIAQNVYRYTPGHIDISPTSYEHVIESNFKLGPSRVITNLVKAGNNLTDPESGKTDAERQKHFLKEVISANRVLYNPNISEDDKRDLYNYLSMSSAKMGSWNEEKVKYAERAIVLTKQKMLVNPKVIQDSLDDLLSQIVFSGKLYQKVPGQEITWAQWYSAMSSIGDKRSAAQHKRYINDKINKALEESGNQEQEE